MKKILITGFAGFVSRHFLNYLETNKISTKVLGLDISAPLFDYDLLKYVECSFKKVDLLENSLIRELLSSFKPDYVLHLASFSSVAYSWEKPVESFVNNTNIYLNLIEEIRKLKIKCRILSIGSSEVYGKVKFADIPLKENAIINPVSPYAVARASQEYLSIIYSDGYGLDIVSTRSFNHVGTYQPSSFALSSFAKQIVEISKGHCKHELVCGNIDVIRDFIDVRDVVEAYYLLFEQGISGQIYNVCCNKGITLREVIEKMASQLNVDIKIKIDPGLIRPLDNTIIIGCNAKIIHDTVWMPKFSIEQSLSDLLNFWKEA